MNPLSRREFTKALAALSTTAALSAFRVRGANERVRLGFIGVGNRGDQVLDAFLKQPDAEVVAICDVYQPYLDFAAAKLGNQPKQFTDYRKLLELKDVDAVVISTPDHWHALQTIHACAAGKDIYLEKPMSLGVNEGRAIVEAIKKTKRICQVGLHRRSSPMCREMADFIRGGGIGHVSFVRTWHIQNEWPKGIGHPADSAPPPGMDWETYLGPAAKVPYNRNRGLYYFRWFFDYGGGQITNNGIHYLDQIHWALGQEAPLTVTALGGKFVLEDNRDIPDTMEALWHYPGNTLVTFTQINANGAAAAAVPCELEFRGTKGTLYFRSNGWEVVPEKITPNEFPQFAPTRRGGPGWRTGAAPMIEPRKVQGNADTAYHARNFLDCLKSRTPCNSDPESAHRSTTTTLLANIALRMKACLEWDARAEKFKNNAAANKLLRTPYRAPYKLPA
ncbi:MAG TPA: Gfo/Idh/MocA family oxidoreductase [Verrucomicrobiota bacterium]|jgi:predicted dehydrogenase|nr:Gfo/Idh/MocA family oxidoreductase [Verrucomicrobiota bacterium]OQB88645.1 MAG: Inositol 2-dehydrogenase [Verrucomicrobia bacterium ADurb.Bin118]HPY30251.1 Gfo/Idh/MocA family oxidoreductase [Verrucomicrobiota bacterium]HQB16869.1 Gfo/Idh/MocA family oxidoreductase [Verrucomicrobiota bacterium]